MWPLYKKEIKQEGEETYHSIWPIFKLEIKQEISEEVLPKAVLHSDLSLMTQQQSDTAAVSCTINSERKVLKQPVLHSELFPFLRQLLDTAAISSTTSLQRKVFPKPPFSHSCLDIPEVLHGHLKDQAKVVQQSVLHSDSFPCAQQLLDTAAVSSTTSLQRKIFPKPPFSYSCLIFLALKNSRTGSLLVSQIYDFISENFPYFQKASSNWKNCVRHNLFFTNVFVKVHEPGCHGARKRFLYALIPAKIARMEAAINKFGKEQPIRLWNSMAYPENLEAMKNGLMGLPGKKQKRPRSVIRSNGNVKGAQGKPVSFQFQKEVDSSVIGLEKRHSDAPVKSTDSSTLKQDSVNRLDNQFCSNLINTDLSVLDIPEVFRSHLKNQAKVVQQSVLHSDSFPCAQQLLDTAAISSTTSLQRKVFPKPPFSYSCLIFLALKNSGTGSLLVSEIYDFISENFPYFQKASDHWKNSVRHNLCLTHFFAKVHEPGCHSTRRRYLYALMPAKIAHMEAAMNKLGKKQLFRLWNSMAYPENLEALKNGLVGLPGKKQKLPRSVIGSNGNVKGAQGEPVSFPFQKEVDSSMIRLEKQHSDEPVKSTDPSTLKQDNVHTLNNQCFSNLINTDLNVLDIPEVFHSHLKDLKKRRRLVALLLMDKI